MTYELLIVIFIWAFPIKRTGGSLVEHHHAGGREFDSSRTNTQGLKNNWVESAAFVIKSANG